MSSKRKQNDDEETDYIPKPPKILSNIHLRNQEKRLIVILERAQLESAKVFISFNMSLNNQSIIVPSHSHLSWVETLNFLTVMITLGF